MGTGWLLEGRVALITGAGSGMGRASALKMAAEGATVVVADRDLEGAQETVALVRDRGIGDAVARRIDVADAEQIAELFGWMTDRYGLLHVLFSHVGSLCPNGLAVPQDEFTRIMDTNLRAAFYCARYGEPLLRQAAGLASVILTSSITGIVGSPYSPIYSMIKHGIVGFGRSLALYLAPDIRVNVLCPGAVQTPMLDGFFDRDPAVDPEVLKKTYVTGAVPLRRAGDADEVADVAVFLASDRSSFMTGTVVPVDGGYTTR